MFIECDCYRNGQRTGIADYFIKLNGNWVPVEAKLNVLVENDIFLQLAKYLHINSFTSTKGQSAGKNVGLSDSPFCVVVDQAGIYLVKESKFVDCTAERPLFCRENIMAENLPKIRKALVGLMR